MQNRGANPRVSVLLPVYNGERDLPTALDSILAQTIQDWELIAVDDGSTDRSGQILQDYAARDDRFRIIRRSNGGVAAALNDALAAAGGEFCARMDADDIALPERLGLQVEYLERNPNCVAVGTQVILIDEDGDEIGPMKGLPTDHESIDRALLSFAWPIVHPSVMMRTDALCKIGGYSVEAFPLEDHDLFLRMAEIGRLANLPQSLLQYRRHTGSVSTESRQGEKKLTVVEAACRRRGISFRPPPFEKPRQLDFNCIWGWQALAAGNIRTAKKYAGRAVRARPFSWECWKLWACVLRGH